MKSFLMSVLAGRYAGDFMAFRQGHPHDWLVWEPGDWKPSSGHTPTLTLAPAQITGPRGGESLCMALSGATRFILGRGPTCALVINDRTLSSSHMAFSVDDRGEWTVEDLKSRNGTKINGTKLEAGTPVPIRTDTRVTAGNVAFTFYSPEGLWARLRKP